MIDQVCDSVWVQRILLTIFVALPLIIGIFAGVKSWGMTKYSHEEIDEAILEILTYENLNFRWAAILVTFIPFLIFMSVFWVSYTLVSFRFIPDFLFKGRFDHVIQYFKTRWTRKYYEG